MNAFARALVISFVGIVALCARADYPTSDIISLNISNDAQYMMTGEGETETLAGLLPDNAWQNTSNADRTGVLHSGDVRNGYSDGVTAWDGAHQQVVALDDVVFTWAVEGDGTANYGNVDASNNPVFHKAWLARLNKGAETSTILLRNIPYEKYDVIVYCFGADDTAFNPVSVNGVYYVGDNTLETETNTRPATSSSETWGGRRATPSLGQTAIRVNGIESSELLLSIRSGATSICAVQVVRDMSAVGEETLAAGKVISVNLQSSHNTNGYKSESYGLVRVPATAWTEDGLSSASAEGADVAAEIKEWNGSTKTSYALSGITINENANNAYYAYKAWNGYGEYIPIANLINAYLDDGGNRALVTVTGVPYKQYDVIVYTATDSKGYYFGPVTVNDTPYRWSNGETVVADSANSTADTRWGYSLCPIPAYGVNALRITGQTSSTLTIKGANNGNTARGGIAGFQIVDTYIPPPMEVDPDGTIEISEPPAEEKSVVCEGSLTVTGTETYTVTAYDLRQFDFTGVAGTVTLGAYTSYPLGSDRALPAAFAFGEGSTVEITETREEFLADLFTVSGLTGVSYVKFTRADGTIETLEVADGEATFGSGNGTTKIDGVATMYDATFTNTTTFAYKNSSGAVIGLDDAVDPKFNNEFNDETTGIYIRHHPYVDGAASDIYGLSDFTVLVVGQMSPTHKTQFIHLGSTARSSYTGLLIATTENDDEVIIAPNTGKTVNTSNAVTVTVPNAATARHVYVITKVGNTFTVSVDGIRRGNFTVADGWTIGASGHSGVQVGSDFGGEIQRNTSDPNRFKAVADSQDETGVINVMRVFDYVISDAQMQAIVEAYPYESEGGLYTRTVADDTDFSSEDAWDRGDESYAVPVGAADGFNPSATITVEDEVTVTVNATLTLDTLTVVGGAETLTFAKSSDYAVKVSGTAVFNSPVVVEYGSLDLAGTPVQIGSAGSLTIDCSSIDVASTYATTHYQLTGLIDEDPDKFEVILPGAAPYREVSVDYNANGYYELVIAPDHEAGSEVYYKQGYWGETDKPADVFSVTNASGATTIVFPGDTVVVPAYSDGASAYVGSPLPANVYAIRIDKDFTFSGGNTGGAAILSNAVVTVAENCTLTIQRNWNNIVLGSVEFNGSGVVLDSNNGTITVSGAVAGTSTLTVKENKSVTVEATGSVANAIVLEDGATLTVKDGATIPEEQPTTSVADSYISTYFGDGETVYSVEHNPPAFEPIAPSEGGSATYDDDDAATSAAEAINADKDSLITLPTEMTTEQKATYLSYVEAKATGNKVDIVFSTDGETALQEAVDAEASDFAEAAIEAAADAVNGGTAEIATTPGLYYVVEAGSDVDGIVPASCTLATGTSLELTIPNKGEKGFYQLRVSTVPVTVTP